MKNNNLILTMNNNGTMFDVIGGTSFIAGMILAVYDKVKGVTDPMTNILMVGLLIFGLFYAVARWRGKILSNRIQRIKLQRLEEIIKKEELDEKYEDSLDV
jgi:hypothetical protein